MLADWTYHFDVLTETFHVGSTATFSIATCHAALLPLILNFPCEPTRVPFVGDPQTPVLATPLRLALFLVFFPFFSW